MYFATLAGSWNSFGKAEIGFRGHLTLRRSVDLPSSCDPGGEGGMSTIQRLDARCCAQGKERRDEAKLICSENKKVGMQGQRGYGTLGRGTGICVSCIKYLSNRFRGRGWPMRRWYDAHLADIFTCCGLSYTEKRHPNGLKCRKVVSCA